MNVTTVPPNFSGPEGEAWCIDLDKVPLAKTEPHSTIALWTVHCPHVHPLWAFYLVSVCHLRPVVGLTEPPLIVVDGATHEMVIAAVNPGKGIPNHNEIPSILFPLNFAAQMVHASDEEAIKHVEDGAVKSIVHGFLNPDTDGLRGWSMAFGDAMVRK